MSPIKWILKETVVSVHEAQILEHGGLYGLRDPSLLESALARPRNLHEYSEHTASFPQLAASYAFGISSNHPFIDGNKRVALVTSYVFLQVNGIKVIASEIDSVNIFLKLAANHISEEEFAGFLTRNSQILG